MNFDVNSVIGQTLKIAKSIALSAGLMPREGTIYACPADVDLNVRIQPDKVTVAGTFSATVLATCDRSLQRFYQKVDGSLDLEFLKDDWDIENAELELDSEDLNVDFHQGSIDIGRIVHEQIALSMPMKMLKPGLPDTFTATFGQQSEDDVDERFQILKELKNRMESRQE